MNSPHLERGGLPIREVTRLTGVHPVTLRAWERRYGLVVPQRTGKGHRLYSEEQVERIRRILVWLERGVAISQVRALLERPEETPAADVESPWERLHEQLLDAIAALAERRLDDLFNQAASLYPVADSYTQVRPREFELGTRGSSRVDLQVDGSGEFRLGGYV